MMTWFPTQLQGHRHMESLHELRHILTQLMKNSVSPLPVLFLPVPLESHDCVTWRRLVFIPVVPGRPPNPEWPHRISHSRLGNGLRTWRYVWGTTLKHWSCLRIKAQRNSPVSKKGLSLILSVAATPKQDNKYDNVCLLLQVLCGTCWGVEH